MTLADPFARIIVAYDGSEPSESALDDALRLAEEHAGEVIVVHISDLSAASVLEVPTCAAPSTFDPEPVLASLDRHRRELFDRLRARVALAAVPVRIEFAMNGAIAGIVEAAVRWKASAIAIGTHARTGIALTFIGSVADGVVRTAALPVIVVRGTRPTVSLHRLLVGIDIEEQSGSASAFALALARCYGMHLTYAAVVDTASLSSPVADVVFDPTPYQDHLRAGARDALDAALQSANAAQIYPDTELTDDPDPAAGLIAAAARHDADAIVVGTHKRGNVDRFIVGSTAEAVLRRSDLPVIVVPADALVEDTATDFSPGQANRDGAKCKTANNFVLSSTPHRSRSL